MNCICNISLIEYLTSKLHHCIVSESYLSCPCFVFMYIIFILYLWCMCICNVCVMCHEYRSSISGSERTSHHDSRPEVMESILGWGIFVVFCFCFFLFVCFILKWLCSEHLIIRELWLKDHRTLFFNCLCTLWHSA